MQKSMAKGELGPRIINLSQSHPQSKTVRARIQVLRTLQGPFTEPRLVEWKKKQDKTSQQLYIGTEQIWFETVQKTAYKATVCPGHYMLGHWLSQAPRSFDSSLLCWWIDQKVQLFQWFSWRHRTPQPLMSRAAAVLPVWGTAPLLPSLVCMLETCYEVLSQRNHVLRFGPQLVVVLVIRLWGSNRINE